MHANSRICKDAKIGHFAFYATHTQNRDWFQRDAPVSYTHLISATVRYVYIGNDDLNHSETLYPYVLNQVITDISSRVLANTVEGYTVSRIEGLPLTIGPNEDRNVITVYYEPQVLTEILDLGVPTGASLGGLNVGDCCE